MEADLTAEQLAADSSGDYYNIEVQRASAGAGARRLRYHGSMVDAYLALEKNKGFGEMADTHIIFMMEHDVKGLGWFKYEYEYSLRNRAGGTPEDQIPDAVRWLDAGLHLVIVNGAFKGVDTPEGRLAHDFHCTRSADIMLPRLKRRFHDVKETQQGRAKMYDLIKDIYGEQIDANIKANTLATKATIVTNLLNNGTLPIEEIAKCAELPLEEALKLKEEHDRKGLN